MPQKTELFNNIVKDFDQMISRICFGYSRTKEEFEDMRQDSYANIWHGLDNFRGDSAIKTWVYRVVLNTCASSVRTRKKEGSSMKIEDICDLSDTSAEQREMLRELYELIEKLGPVDKAVILLWLDGYSYDEISDTTGMGRNAVASRIKRAKEKLTRL